MICAIKQGELIVSILTRPAGRVLPGLSPFRLLSPGFNPHTTRRPGATQERPIIVVQYQVFQSSPDPQAGCYHLLLEAIRHLVGFNPHPTRRPGATTTPI